MTTTIQRVSLPDGRRILMLSDIHAHFDDFRAVLEKAAFNTDDVLIIAGDLIEKGAQSLPVIRFVMGLMKTHTVYPLMGNVELWRIQTLQSDDPALWRDMAENSLRCKEWWGGSLLHEMCRELGVDLTAETDIAPLIPEIRRRFAPEIAFLSSLPTILETQRMIFVHAGIPHENLDLLAGADPYPLLKFDDFYNSRLSFLKTVVVGHWPAVLYSKTSPDFKPVIDRKRRIVSMDGACGVKYEGQLNLLTLPDWRSDDFSLITQDHLPVITALEDQEGSPPEEATYIRWNDHAVSLLSKGEELSRVAYYGKIIDVPTQFIFDHNGVLSCSDTTDYRLDVQKGDSLYLILRLSTGCLVKKNSVAGWYYGRYTCDTEETV